MYKITFRPYQRDITICQQPNGDYCVQVNGVWLEGTYPDKSTALLFCLLPEMDREGFWEDDENSDIACCPQDVMETWRSVIDGSFPPEGGVILL